MAAPLRPPRLAGDRSIRARGHPKQPLEKKKKVVKKKCRAPDGKKAERETSETTKPYLHILTTKSVGITEGPLWGLASQGLMVEFVG